MKMQEDAILEQEWEQEIDLRQYWNVVNRSKWAILGLSVTVTLLSAVVVFTMTPTFSASVTILIESQQANIVSIEEIYGLDTRNEQYYKTQVELLNARPLVEKVVDVLKLVEGLANLQRVPV